MDRRKFCRLTSLLALGAAIMPRRAFAATAEPDTTPLRRCRITVIRRECFPDLQSRYLDDPEAGPCPLFTCGQEFTVSAADFAEMEKSPSFCPKAWNCIRSHVEQVLAEPQPGCGESPSDKAVIACCSDGTRPVVFKIVPLA